MIVYPAIDIYEGRAVPQLAPTKTRERPSL